MDFLEVGMYATLVTGSAITLVYNVGEFVETMRVRRAMDYLEIEPRIQAELFKSSRNQSHLHKIKHCLTYPARGLANLCY